MQHNFIDSSIDVNGELDNNGRRRNIAAQGVSNRPYASGMLGSYIFKLSPMTPSGTYTNSTDSIYCYDENNFEYASPLGTENPTFNTDNQPFKVLPEPKTLGISASLIACFKKKSNYAPRSYSNPCLPISITSNLPSQLMVRCLA